ncbi:MAG: NADH-quinone oxidoreductase subunit N [Candidatus Koribacter versatilis]|uniref:NADH-quinone oxidoreductase subunit N n=1 Tax=Candidatus Korobacter versatilis TaxID=658062 RepID=A0A932A6T2_9BACT|nr:NADH-quinone oxidoreductase subunit N [Candidatus Koribacter versatilis]
MVVMPMVMLTLFACGVLIIDLLLPAGDKRWNAATAALGLLFAGGSLWRVQATLAHQGMLGVSAFNGSVVMDPMAIFFCWLFLIATGITILISVRYMEIEQEDHGEYYALMLFSVVGMMCMASGKDIVLLFIGLELMAISTYVLVGFLRRDKRSNEAALKYLLLGAFSSGIFAYGLSLMYGLSGTTDVTLIGRRLAGLPESSHPILMLAVVTTLAGLFFKIAAVPFHQWAPDAYEGAPTAITGFMSVAGKAAAWALLLRIFAFALRYEQTIWMPMVIAVAVMTLTGGNLAAMTQNNLKRLLAYSSIAHVGYMLLGLVAWNETGIKGILVYLLVYTFMNLGAFAVIVSLRRRDLIGDEIDDIAGLWFKRPVEALLMVIFLLSLGGIPPLAGFYGKYFIFLSLIETGHYVLASLAVFYIAVSLYYYLRIINAMLMRPALDAEPIQPAFGLRLALWVTALATVGIGLFPEIFIRAAAWTMTAPRAVTQAFLR